MVPKQHAVAVWKRVALTKLRHVGPLVAKSVCAAEKATRETICLDSSDCGVAEEAYLQEDY